MDIDLDADTDALVAEYQRLAEELQKAEQTPVRVEHLDLIRRELADRLGGPEAANRLV